MPEGEYTELCNRLLKQYKGNLSDETVSRAFVDLETFKRQWNVRACLYLLKQGGSMLTGSPTTSRLNVPEQRNVYASTSPPPSPTHPNSSPHQPHQYQPPTMPPHHPPTLSTPTSRSPCP